METLTLIPRGNVVRDVDYGNRVVSFESGTQQIQRTWTKPRITFSVEAVGDVAMKNYLQDFFDKVGGNYKPFWWTYDGVKYPCRFAESKLAFTEVRGYEGEGTVGYSANVGIIVCKESEYVG